MLRPPETEGITFVTLCVNAERGMWRTACTCHACCHAKCLKCGLEWWTRPDPLTCPKCKHPYVKWVNYADFIKTHQHPT